jgi:two-component system, OmpR family, sensor histidine kinase KdpD
VRQFKRILSIGLKQKRSWKRFFWDGLLALVGSLLVTLFIYALSLYPRIANIELIYLIVVLALASTRGLLPAIFASVVAFFSFDFFLIQPLFSFTIAKPEEWLALFVFLCTAVITGQLASALRLRAEQARQSEHETRILYELVRDTNEQEDLDHQLSVIAHTMVEVFRPRGVRDSLILLPDENGKLARYANASIIMDQLQLTSDELRTAAWVMREGKAVEFYNLGRVSPKARSYSARMVIRSTALSLSSRNYLSLFPLKTGQKVVGVLCLQMQEDPRLFSREKRLGSEAERSDPGSAFFWTFVDQAASMIERARLRREGLQVEILQRTDVLRAALISSVSHDLRTPLTSIKAAASSLLQDDVQWDEEARRSFTQAIEHEADRLNRLVENLLDISRIEGGALKPEKEWYPLDELVHDVLSRMQVRMQGRKVTTELAANLPPIALDYIMIDQVLTNLLENALRYTPAGSVLELTVSVMATEVLISLADRGPGIPAGDLERIFDKFYRVLSRDRDVGGSGLGLAVCRGLIEAHGGRIWAENRLGGGTVFQFTLPLKDIVVNKAEEEGLIA